MCDQLTARQRMLGGIAFSVILTLATISAQTSHTWYASAPNSSTPPSGTACTLAAPCTFSYALASKIAAGDTLLLYPGDYNDQAVRITKDNVMISAIPSAISGITFDKGQVVGGVDNRPRFLGTGIPYFSITGSGVTLSYLRIRGLATGSYLTAAATTGIVEIANYPTTLDHLEVYSGGTIVKIYAGQQITIQDSNLHGAGYYPVSYPFPGLPSYPNDATHSDPHIIAILTTGPVGSSFATGIKIRNNSLWEAVGNGVQEQSDCYGSPKTIFRFITMDGNHIYNNHKQAWDAKGTQDVIFSNNLVEHNDYGHIAINTPSDCSSNGPMDRWEIFNNVFRYSTQTVAVWSNRPNCSNHHWYNNVIYNNQTDAGYNGPAVWMCGDAGSTFYNNTMFNNGNFGPQQNGGIIDCGSGNNIRNNIFYNNGTRASDYGNIASNQYGCNQAGTPTNNYIVGKTAVTGTNVISTCFATGNCAGFVDIVNNNYRLLSGSPARRAGVSNLGAPYNSDILGAARTAPWDLGAYAFGGIAAPTNLRIIR